MLAPDTNILLQTKPVDLTSLGDSLNPAAIYQRGLELRSQGQQVKEQQRQLSQAQALREAASRFDLSTDQGKAQYLDAIRNNPATADKYSEALQAFQQQKIQQQGIEKTGYELPVEKAKSELQQRAYDAFRAQQNPSGSVIGDPGGQQVQGAVGSYGNHQAQQLPIHQRLQQLKGLVANDDYMTAMGIPVAPTNKVAYNNAIIEANQNIRDALVNEVGDSKTGKTWAQLSAELPAGKTNLAGALADKFLAKHPEIQYLPDAEKVQYTKDKLFSAPQQPNMAVIMQGLNKGLPDNLLGPAIDRIHKRQSSIEDEIGKGRMFGIAPDVIRQQLIGGVNQKYGEDYDPSQASSGQKFQHNVPMISYVAAMDNARGTVQRLNDVISKNGNLESKTATKLINALKTEFNDVQQAEVNALRGVGQEELAPAFSRGGGQTTDKARELAQSLTPTNLSSAATKATLRELLISIDRNRQAVEKASYGFVKPPEYDRTDGQGNPVYGSKTLALAKKALTDPAATPEHKAKAKQILEAAGGG